MRHNGRQREIVLVVSVDTEEDNWQPTRTSLTVENLRALPRLVGFFRRFGIRPTLFASYQVLLQPWTRDILRELSASGDVEVGTHLHPWNTPPVVEPLQPRYTMLCNLPAQLQQAKLESLTALYRDVFGRSPVSFRAGRFALGAGTVRALTEVGYEVDSSVTPLISWAKLGGPSFIGAPLTPYRLGSGNDPRRPVTNGPLIEVPLSAGFTRFRPSAWSGVDRALGTPVARLFHIGGWAARTRLMRRIVLSPEINSVRAMLALSRALLNDGASYLHLFFHSSTLLAGCTPYARTSRDVEGLYRTLEEYLDALARLVSLRAATVGEVPGALGFQAPAAVLAREDAAAVHGAAPAVRRKLLVITYHFPPDGAVGGLRWGGLTKYLQRLGWEVCVLTAATKVTHGPADPLVYHCPRARTILDRYREFGRRRNRSVRAGDQPERRRTSLRGELIAALSLPDESRGWVLRAARRARALIQSFRPDVVVSSGPPHAAHLVARLATAGSGVRWLVDMRDPWPHMVPQIERWEPVQGTTTAEIVMPRIERAVVGRADGLFASTRALANRLAARYPHLPVTWVRNGVDPERLAAQPAEPRDGFLMSYVGTLYGNRSLGTVLKALRRFIDRRSLPPGAVRLEVAGLADEPYRSHFLEAVSALALEDYAVLVGTLPGGEALRQLRRSDLALVLAQGQKLQVPAKLYEAVGLGIPTLVVADRGGATAEEAAWLGALVVEPHDVDAMSQAFERVHGNPGEVRSVPPSEILHPCIAERVSRLLWDRDFFVLQAWSEGVPEP